MAIIFLNNVKRANDNKPYLFHSALQPPRSTGLQNLTSPGTSCEQYT